MKSASTGFVLSCWCFCVLASCGESASERASALPDASAHMPDAATPPDAESDAAAGSAPLDRVRDPVVIRGIDLQPLLGRAVDEIVAFSWNDGWTQIPVQIDERHVVQPSMHYKDAGCCIQPSDPKPSSQATVIAYADSLTYAGADPNAAFDADDELVFMARDSGRLPASFTAPEGVDAGASSLRIRLSDPLEPGRQGYVHLFVRKDSALTADAGRDYVKYDVSFGDGHTLEDYLTEYDRVGTKHTSTTIAGCEQGYVWLRPNPEQTKVETATYRAGFSERWVFDQLTPMQTGIDLIDLQLIRITPTSCGRSNASFSGAEGGFIAQKDGAVRAVRSVLGANSGPTTQATHFFYEGRIDVIASMRVHTMPGAMDLMDYSPDAGELRYWNSLNAAGEGVKIDGQPGDELVPGPALWEIVSGPAGALVMRRDVRSSFLDQVTLTSWFHDQSDAPCQCLGDAHAWGTSGAALANSLGDQPDEFLPDTTPASRDYISGLKTIEVYGSALDADQRMRAVDRLLAPLKIEVQPVDGSSQSPVAPPACGDTVCDFDEASGWCAADCPWKTCGNGSCEPYELVPGARCDADCGSLTGQACGDDICSADEQDITCPFDCPSQHVYELSCLIGACPDQHSACMADTGSTSCTAALSCFAKCAGKPTECAVTCRSTATGTSRDLLDALFACGVDNFCG